jgi:hypothetical protein
MLNAQISGIGEWGCSMFNGAVIDELVKDAMHFTLHSSSQDSTVVRNASRALAWLEAVFTGFVVWSDNAGKEPTAGSFMLKAHAHVPLDSSLLLQVGLYILILSINWNASDGQHGDQ